MSKEVFSNDEAGTAAANAVSDPKHIWITPGKNGRIIVFTGSDIPNKTIPVGDLVLSRFQLIRAFAMAGKAGSVTTAVAELSAARQTLWAEANTFTRGHSIINAIKNRIANFNDNDMDDVFRVGSAIVETDI